MAKGDRKTVNGVIYEDLGNGQAVIVGYENNQQAPQQTAPEVRAEQRDIQTQRRADAQLGIAFESNARAGRSEGRDATNSVIDNIGKFRSAYEGLPPVKEYRAAIPIFMAGLKAKPDASGDNSLLYAYAKVMDPGSVVREGEMGMAANGAAYWQNSVANLQKQLGIEGGGQLPPDVRERLKRDMQMKVQEMGLLYRQQRQRFAADAQSFGIEPERVIGPDDFAPYVKEWERLQQPKDQPMKAAGFGATTQSIDLPPEMQRANNAFLAGWNGDPESYVKFRKTLDQEFGFNSAPDDELRNWASMAAKARAQGSAIPTAIPPVQAPLEGFDKFRNDLVSNPVGAGAVAFANAGSFGALNNIGDARRGMDALANQYPGATIAGDIAGSIAGAGALAKFGGRAMQAGGALGAEMTYGGVRGFNEAQPGQGVQGAALGAAAGLAGNLAGRGVGYGLARAGQTQTGQAIANSMLQGVNRVGNAGRALFGRGAQPAATFAPPVPGAERLVAGAFPDPAMAQQQLAFAAQNNLPMGLADVAISPRMLAGAAFRNASPDLRDRLAQEIQQRGLDQVDRARSAIESNLAPSVDIVERSAKIMERGKPVYDPLYQQAYQGPTVTSPRIEQILSTPAGRQAVGKANTIAANEMRDPRSIGFAVDDAGRVVLNDPSIVAMDRLDAARNGWDQANKALEDALRRQQASLQPSLLSKDVEVAQQQFQKANAELDAAKQFFNDTPRGGSVKDVPGYTPQSLDYVKGAFDDMLEPYRNPVTNRLELDRNGRAINAQKNSLLNELDGLNPDYGAARAAYGQYAKQAEALTTGNSLLTRSNMNQRNFDRMVGRAQNYDAALPQGQQSLALIPELQRGYATNMVDAVERARLVGNPYNAVFGTTLQQGKVRALFPQGADNFAQIANAERQMAMTQQELMGGSATQPRQIANEQFSGDVNNMGRFLTDAAVDTAITGAPVRAGVQAAKGIMGKLSQSSQDRKIKASADEILPLLLNTDPNSARAALEAAIQRDEELARLTRDYINRSTRRVGMFGSGVGAAGAGYYVGQ